MLWLLTVYVVFLYECETEVSQGFIDATVKTVLLLDLYSEILDLLLLWSYEHLKQVEILKFCVCEILKTNYC